MVFCPAAALLTGKRICYIVGRTRGVIARMTVAICDDNKEFLRLFQERLEAYYALKDWPHQCRSFASGAALLKSDLAKFDVVFLDIDMPDVNGLDVARQLRSRYPELVIVFVTAYIEYAVDGYSVDAFRYLLKDRLAEMLPPCLDAIESKLISSQETIQAQTLTNTVTFRARDITYLEGTPTRHVVVHTYQKEATECLGKLSDYEKRLAEKGFLRIQRSYLVNALHIERMQSYSATLTTGENLPVSRTLYRQVYESYMKWRGHRI